MNNLTVSKQRPALLSGIIVVMIALVGVTTTAQAGFFGKTDSISFNPAVSDIAKAPSLAATKNGDIYLAYQRYYTSYSEITFKRNNAASGLWQDSISFTARSSMPFAERPKIVCDPLDNSGSAILGFIDRDQNDTSKKKLYLKKYTGAGLTWVAGIDTVYSPAGSGDVLNFDIAYGNGSAMAVLSQISSGYARTFARRYTGTPSATVDTIDKLSGGIESANPRIVWIGSNAMLAVYTTVMPNGDSLQISRKFDSGVWASSIDTVAITRGEHLSLIPAIVSNQNGQAMAAYCYYDTVSFKYNLVSKIYNGTSWSNSTLIDTCTNNAMTGVQLVCNKNGQVAISYNKYANYRYTVMGTAKTAPFTGGAWFFPNAINENTYSHSRNQSSAIDDSGNVLFLCEQKPGSSYFLGSQVFHISNSSWDRWEKLNSQEMMDPPTPSFEARAIFANGKGMAVWSYRYGGGGSTQLYTSKYIPTNILGEWKIPNSSTIPDYSFFKQDGAKDVGVILNPSGRVAAIFPATGGRVVVTDSAKILSGMKKLIVSVWAKRHRADTSETILAKASAGDTSFSYRLRFLSNDSIEFDVRNEVNSVYVAQSNQKFLPGVWHHYVGVWTGSQVQIYVDGVIRESSGNSGQVRSDSVASRLYFGANPDGSNQFAGELGHIEIRNDSLSPQLLRALFVRDSATYLGNTPATVVDQGVSSATLLGGAFTDTLTINYSFTDPNLDAQRISKIEFDPNLSNNWKPALSPTQLSNLPFSTPGNGSVRWSSRDYLMGDHKFSNLRFRYNLLDAEWSTNWSFADSMISSNHYGCAIEYRYGNIHVFGGGTNGTDNLVFNGATNTWTSLGAIVPFVRKFASVASVNKWIYLMGGENSNNTLVDSVLAFHPDSGFWKTCASMPTARKKATAVALNGKIFVMGGERFSSPIQKVEMYDPAVDSWTTVDSMDVPRMDGAACAINGKIYMVSGVGNSMMTQDTAEYYDPAQNNWFPAPKPKYARGGASATVVNGKITLVGGTKFNVPVSAIEQFDPITNKWSQREPINNPPKLAAVGILGNRLMIIDKDNSSSLRQCFTGTISNEVITNRYTVDNRIPPTNNMHLSAATIDTGTIRLSWSPLGALAPDVANIGIWWKPVSFSTQASRCDTVNGQRLFVRAFSTTDTNYTFSIAGNSEQNYYFTLLLQDTAGNWSDINPLATNVARRLDLTPPTNNLVVSARAIDTGTIVLRTNKAGIADMTIDSMAIYIGTNQTVTNPYSVAGVRLIKFPYKQMKIPADSVQYDTIRGGMLQKHLYYVSAFLSDGSRNWSAAQTASVITLDKTKPDNFISLSATLVQQRKIQLTWNPQVYAGTDADSIIIVARNFGGAPVTPKDSGTVGICKFSILEASAFTDSAIGFNQTRYYAAFVRDSAGNFSDGTASSRATATTANARDTIAPKNPLILSATSQTLSSIMVSWTSIVNPDKDITQMKIGYSTTPVIDTTAPTFSWSSPFPYVEFGPSSIGNLSPMTQYYFVGVVGDSSGNWSPFSTLARASASTAPSRDTTPPTNTLVLTATNKNDTAVSLNISRGSATQPDVKFFYLFFRTGSPILSLADTVASTRFSMSYKDTVIQMPVNRPAGMWYFGAVLIDTVGNMSAITGTSVLIKNTAPSFIPHANITLKPNQILNEQLNAFDRNQDVLSYRLITGPVTMILTGPGRLSWIPTDTADFGKPLTITYGINDGTTEMFDTFMIMVPKPSKPPVLRTLVLSDTTYVGNIVSGFAIVNSANIPDTIFVVKTSIIPAWLSNATVSLVSQSTGDWRITFTGKPAQLNAGLNNFYVRITNRYGDTIALRDSIMVINAPQVTLIKKDTASGAARYILNVANALLASTQLSWSLKGTGADSVITLFTGTDATANLYPLLNGKYLFSCSAVSSGVSSAVPYRDTLVIKGASSATWQDTGVWHLVAVPAASYPAEALKANGTLTRWDESMPARDVYGYYRPSTEIATLRAGASYWRRASSGAVVNLTRAQLVTDSITTITLSKGLYGWNQVASPYAFPVAWTDKSILFTYNSMTRDFEEAGSVLKPWVGYWAFTPDSNKIVSIAGKPVFGTGALTKQAKHFFAGADNWQIQCAIASNGVSGGSVIGMSPAAQDGFDALDKPQPPRMSDGQYIYVPHAEWKRGTGEFSSDIRKNWDANKLNIYQVAYSPAVGAKTPAQLSLLGIGQIAGNLHVFIQSGEGVIELGADTVLSIPAMSKTQYLTIYVTTQKNFGATFPAKFAVASPWPNPCFPTAHIKYTLPFSFGADGMFNQKNYKVEIVLYDISGRAIRHLVDREQTAGTYTTLWNGTSNTGRIVATGTYYLRVCAGQYSAVKKIMLMK